MPIVYLVDGATVDALRQSLNFSLQNIADRLDKLEGIRGKASLLTKGVDIVGNLEVKDVDENVIHSME